MTSEDEEPGELWSGQSAGPGADIASAKTGAPAGPVVRVRYQLTEDEVVSELRLQMLRSGRVRVLFVCAVVLVLVGAGLMFTPKSQSAVLFLVMGLAYLAMLVRSYVGGPARMWRKSAGLRGPQILALYPSGIYARSVGFEARSQWGVYSGATETDRCYVLRLAVSRATTFVPKRVFASRVDEDAFRTLVAQHIPVEFKPWDSAST